MRKKSQKWVFLVVFGISIFCFDKNCFNKVYYMFLDKKDKSMKKILVCLKNVKKNNLL